MAYVEAISNGGSGTTAARANAVRSGYFARNRVVVDVGGATRKARKDSITIREASGGEPSTADLTMVGGDGTAIPTRGMALIVGHGTTDNKIFGGRVHRVTRRMGRLVDRHAEYDLEASGFERDLAAMACTGLVVHSLSATSIAKALYNATTPAATDMGLSIPYVQDGLTTLAEFKAAHGESALDAFTRLADVASASFYVDYNQAIHFYDSSSLDPQPKTTLATVTDTAKIWNVEHVTDNSQVMTVVVGYGGRVRTTADVWSYETIIPVDALEPVCDLSTINAASIYRMSSTNEVILDGLKHKNVFGLDKDKALNFQEAIYQASPISLMTNSYWVGAMAGTYPGSLYMNGRIWWADGAYTWRVASLAVVSTSANTIYHHFIVPAVGPGAPPPTQLGVLPAGHFLTTPEFELRFSGANSTSAPYVIPSGTEIRAFYSTANSTEIAGGGWYGSPAVRVITGRVDEDLPPKRLMQACSAALNDGSPGNWVTMTYDTRDVDHQRGQKFSALIQSAAGSPTYNLAGPFTITNVEIGDFDQTTESFGPVRRVTATIARPNSLWRVLRLER